MHTRINTHTHTMSILRYWSLPQIKQHIPCQLSWKILSSVTRSGSLPTPSCWPRWLSACQMRPILLPSHSNGNSDLYFSEICVYIYIYMYVMCYRQLLLLEYPSDLTSSLLRTIFLKYIHFRMYCSKCVHTCICIWKRFNNQNLSCYFYWEYICFFYFCINARLDLYAYFFTLGKIC